MSETPAPDGQLVLFAPDRPVSAAELDELWETCRRRGETHNGVTTQRLAERYGTRVYRVAGRGWFVRAAETTHP